MTIQIATADGWSLHVRHLVPQGTPVGAALLTHAMMVDHRTFDRPRGAGLAATLQAAGWSVFLADTRGRGGSGPTVQQGGDWGYDDIVRYDVPALVRAIRGRCGGPLVLVGHSLGGHTGVAATTHLDRPLDGLVLLAANVWMPRLDTSRRIRMAKQLSIRSFESIARFRGYFPSRSLRMGPVDESGRYVRDLARYWRHDAWMSENGKIDYTQVAGAVRAPVLCVTGAGDRLFAHVTGAQAFAGLMHRASVERWHLRRGERGLSWDPDHMGLVTDVRCKPVWRDIADWMSRLAL